MPAQCCCTCNIIVTYATYGNPGHCYIAGIILKDGCSKVKQWLNSATKLKRNSSLCNKKDFCNDKLALFSLDTPMFIRLPLRALVIQQNYLSNQRRDKEWPIYPYSFTPSLSRQGLHLALQKDHKNYNAFWNKTKNINFNMLE